MASQLKIPVQEIDKLADEHGELHDEKDAGQLFIDMLSLWVLKNNSDATLSNLLAHMQILKWNHAVGNNILLRYNVKFVSYLFCIFLLWQFI